MAKNITLMGANYPQVPAVQLPQTGGGTATFYDSSRILKPGNNYIGKAVLAGYSTGSGNYIGVYLPIDTSHISSITSVSISDTSVAFTTNGRVPFSATTYAETKEVLDTGVFLEFRYPTTQAANTVANLMTNGMEIVCA